MLQSFKTIKNRLKEVTHMAITISIALQKGGVGKTATALNLAAELGLRKKNVLLIDLDAQADSTYSSGYNTSDLEYSLYNVLTTDNEYHCNIEQAILNCKYYDLLPADSAVNDLTLELKDFEALKKVLELVQNKYDFIILDCPPAISMITANAFVASQNIIIPSECRTYSFLAMMDLKQSINEIKESLNPDLKVLGILLVKYDKRTTLTKQMQDMIIDFSEQLHTTVYNATIRNGIAVEESALNQVPLCDYVRKNNNKPYIDYRGFVTETLKRLELK